MSVIINNSKHKMETYSKNIFTFRSPRAQQSLPYRYDICWEILWNFVNWSILYDLCISLCSLSSSLFLLLAIRYRQTRFSSKRVRKRVVFKHGECNVVQGNVAKRRRRYLQVSCRRFLYLANRERELGKERESGRENIEKHVWVMQAQWV